MNDIHYLQLLTTHLNLIANFLCDHAADEISSLTYQSADPEGVAYL